LSSGYVVGGSIYCRDAKMLMVMDKRERNLLTVWWYNCRV